MKIHCAQLVEGALRNALTGEKTDKATGPTLIDNLSKGASPVNKVKVVLATDKHR